MRLHRHSEGSRPWGVPLLSLVALACAAAVARAEPVIATVPARVRPLIADLPAAGSMAAPASGQTVYVVDEATRAVLGCDPFVPDKRWTAIPAPRSPDNGPVAIACIDSTTLAAVGRAAEGWALATYRLEAPGAAAAAAVPRSTHPLGPASDDDRPQVTVGLSRDWLVVFGFQAPASRMQLMTIRGAAPIPAGRREAAGAAQVVAVAATPGDGLAVFEVDPRLPAATARLTLSAGLLPRSLLVVDTELPAVRGAAASRGTGDLWVVAGAPGSSTTPEGLWRIEATLHRSRQATRAVCVARFDAPRGLVWISDRMILVVHGREARTVSHVDPTTITITTPGADSP